MITQIFVVKFLILSLRLAKLLPCFFSSIAPNPTYISPRPQTGTYPRTQRTPHLTGHPQIPREPPPSIGNHTVPPPLPHRPSEDYIDMSNQKKKVSGVENGPAVGSQRALDVQLVRREIPEEVRR